MTDAEKLADYDRILQIINDALALEEHFAQQGKSCDAIEFLRADAYKNIVDQAVGPDALRRLETERAQTRAAGQGT